MDANRGTVNCSTLPIYAIPKSMTSGMAYINLDMDFSWGIDLKMTLSPFRIKSRVTPIGPFPPCRDEKAMVVGCTPNKQTLAKLL